MGYCSVLICIKWSSSHGFGDQIFLSKDLEGRDKLCPKFPLSAPDLRCKRRPSYERKKEREMFGCTRRSSSSIL